MVEGIYRLSEEEKALEPKYKDQDIKAEEINNIWISVIDFGFTRPSVLCFKERVGTPSYLAPEIILGLNYTSKVDSWAIGVELFVMATGHMPFSGGLDDMSDMYFAICFKKVDEL